MPLFEFSLPNSSPFPHSEHLPPFLEVGELGPFYQGDKFEAFEESEYEEMVQEAAAQKNWLGDEIPGSGAMVPSPNSGYWWKVLYALVEQDAERWQSVKNAMGRGKCRVVVRYEEFEEFEADAGLGLGDGEGEGNGDVEMEDRVFGLGIEFEDGAGGGGLSLGKKRERLVGRQRVTRSEARRRSGLGLSEVSSGGVVMGVGAPMGESARSRVVGNKDLSAAGGGGGGGGGGGVVVVVVWWCWCGQGRKEESWEEVSVARRALVNLRDVRVTKQMMYAILDRVFEALHRRQLDLHTAPLVPRRGNNAHLWIIDKKQKQKLATWVVELV